MGRGWTPIHTDKPGAFLIRVHLCLYGFLRSWLSLNFWQPSKLRATTRIMFSLRSQARTTQAHPSRYDDCGCRRVHADLTDPLGPFLTSSTPMSRKGYQGEALAS